MCVFQKPCRGRQLHNSDLMGNRGKRLKTENNDTQFIVSTCAQLLEEIKCTSGVNIVLWSSFHHSRQKANSGLKFWENFHFLILILILLLFYKIARILHAF